LTKLTREDFSAALVDAFEILARLDVDRMAPSGAIQLLSNLPAPSAFDRELLWWREPYDNSVDYTMLLTSEKAGTASLSFSSRAGPPLPFRGVHRWSDQDLVRVNSRMLTVGEAIAYLDPMWGSVNLMRRLIDLCIIRDEVEARGIEVSDDELQAGLDAFRRERGLLTERSTRQWLHDRGLTHPRLEQLVTEHLQLERLRHLVSAEATTVDTDDEGRAGELLILSIAFGSRSEADGVLETFLGASDPLLVVLSEASALWRNGGRSYDLQLRTVRRRDISSDATRTLLDSCSSEWVGPFEWDGSWLVARSVARRPEAASLTSLFDEWLARRRSLAAVEWYWGESASGRIVLNR
jgi:putative peptide maturation system protein